MSKSPEYQPSPSEQNPENQKSTIDVVSTWTKEQYENILATAGTKKNQEAINYLQNNLACPIVTISGLSTDLALILSSIATAFRAFDCGVQSSKKLNSTASNEQEQKQNTSQGFMKLFEMLSCLTGCAIIDGLRTEIYGLIFAGIGFIPDVLKNSLINNPNPTKEQEKSRDYMQKYYPPEAALILTSMAAYGIGTEYPNFELYSYALIVLQLSMYYNNRISPYLQEKFNYKEKWSIISQALLTSGRIMSVINMIDNIIENPNYIPPYAFASGAGRLLCEDIKNMKKRIKNYFKKTKK